MEDLLLLYMGDLKIFTTEEVGLGALIQTVKACNSDIGMGLGMEKCGVEVMKRGKMVN